MPRRKKGQGAEPTAPRAAIYLRVSTEEQAKEGFGLAAQQARCAAMAVVKGWTVAQVFRDEGISGTLDAAQRPGLQALLDAASNKQVDAVIILALDRLGRKARIVLELIDELAESGTEIVSCKEQIDTTTPAGRFVLTIFAALAQLERDNIVERTTGGRNERGKRDGERGGGVPYGYRRVHDVATGKAVGLTVDDARAPVVRAIYTWRKQGTTLREIAETLNQRGVPSSRGSTWHASGVAEILKNEAEYKGGHRGASRRRWPAIL